MSRNNFNSHAFSCKEEVPSKPRILFMEEIIEPTCIRENNLYKLVDGVTAIIFENGKKMLMRTKKADEFFETYRKERNEVIRSRPRPAVVFSPKRRNHALELNFQRAPRTQHLRESRSKAHSDEGGGEDGGSSDPDEPAPIAPFYPVPRPKREREAVHVSTFLKTILSRLRKITGFTLSLPDRRMPL